MNCNLKRIALSLMTFMAAAGISQAAITKDFYKTTVLKQGHWVKVGVDQTGVYEISYDKLREMGFDDPSKVSVYGRGGYVLSENFVTNAGVAILTDDISPIKIIHDNDMIYFYGLGPEEISFTTSSSYDTGGYFERKSNNIYTRRGYYFLTDSQPVVKMSSKDYESSSAIPLSEGLSYVYHELDSLQNTTASGQLFWGEDIGHPGPQIRTWDVDLPGSLGGNGVMHCELYGFRRRDDKDMGFGPDATVSYGFQGQDLVMKTPYNPNTQLYFSPHEPKVAAVGIPAQKGKVFVEFKGEDMGEASNLDFWVVTYPVSLSALPAGTNQYRVAFPSLTKNTRGKLTLGGSNSLEVIDVTNVNDPQRMKVKNSNGQNSAWISNTSKAPVIIVFDKNEPQLQISGFELEYAQVANQNLHAYKDTGADFIIITTPSLRPYAEEIAQLHRDHDGMQVVVATTEECYNEFSGGTPDPMAYRSFAKMLYLSDRKPKNMLLFGPLYGDFRGIQKEHDPYEAIIAYQSPQISLSRGAYNINDFYGVMTDKYKTDFYERNEVNIGVGILPIKFESDAKIVVDKIRNYLERTDFAYYLNQYTSMSGIGDSHTHDGQIRDLYTYLRALENDGTMYTPLSIDSYGNTEAQKKFFNQLNEGCGFFSYFGHGAEQFLGKDRRFFNAGDVYKLRNTVLPIGLFAGCRITNTDRGFRGLGETIVTSTPYGAVGTVVSARETWSNQNMEFFKLFFVCLYKQGSYPSSAHRDTPATIGEVYAQLKNYSTYSNELAYQLLCDPALKVPVIIRSFNYTSDAADGSLKPGDKFTISGTVTKDDGSVDTGFNGQLVVRLNEPEKVVPGGNIETGDPVGTLAYKYRDAQVSMAVADIKDGRFTASIHVPSSMDSFQGQNSLLYLCGYDPSTKTGAGKCFDVPVAVSQDGNAEASDVVPPVIEVLAFDNADCALSFTVSDDVALNFSNSPLNKGLTLYIDGKERPEAHFITPMIEPDRVAFSKYVPVDGLSYGEHTARLTARDAAGNSTQTEIQFTYKPYEAKYVILKDEVKSSPESTVISFADGISPANARLVVIDALGNEVWNSGFQNGNAEWNHVDMTGAKVKAGHYKAYIIETGNGSNKGHSETIDIPVI